MRFSDFFYGWKTVLHNDVIRIHLNINHLSQILQLVLESFHFCYFDLPLSPLGVNVSVPWQLFNLLCKLCKLSPALQLMSCIFKYLDVNKQLNKERNMKCRKYYSATSFTSDFFPDCFPQHFLCKESKRKLSIPTSISELILNILDPVTDLHEKCKCITSQQMYFYL